MLEKLSNDISLKHVFYIVLIVLYIHLPRDVCLMYNLMINSVFFLSVGLSNYISIYFLG